MARLWRTMAFWAALVVSTILLLAVAAATIWAVYARSTLPPDDKHIASLGITYGGLLIISGGIFSGIFFGWRQERREARDLRQRNANLQYDIHELEQKIATHQRNQGQS